MPPVRVFCPVRVCVPPFTTRLPPAPPHVPPSASVPANVPVALDTPSTPAPSATVPLPERAVTCVAAMSEISNVPSATTVLEGVMLPFPCSSRLAPLPITVGPV
ncbi:hypothetical protein GLUCOINTEAF2_0203017 [Komagataeibacter intermedius AF2]|uniref:Uncharacterized protein n=1 Tax=Komagataeibacter intermedius AF2 TaxID=1458464 RepID=A0A0N1F9R2_9PROT|nr:hypothetical protein GLUCOINTEAF2_0203017 [Komagataeibacter intermedius AF2]